MKAGPNIARIAALIGDPARAQVLTALMADRAMTATELATMAGVTRQTVSAHLGKLVEAGMLVCSPQGRHRYFRLADHDVAEVIELLMGIAFRTGDVRVRSGPREPALRKARACYDHLAGEYGVLAFESMLAQRLFNLRAEALQLTAQGRTWFARMGVDIDQYATQRRALCRPCLDWGERRHHLGGALGKALLQRLIGQDWLRRSKGSRVLVFSASGERKFLDCFRIGQRRIASHQ